MKRQYLHLSTYSCDKCRGPVVSGFVQQDDDSTKAIYGKNVKFRKILSGKVSTPQSADAFMKAVSDAGHQARIAEAQNERR